jgi:hypothetical protein
MKVFIALLVFTGALLGAVHGAEVPDLDLGALVQPYEPAVSAYADEGYHCWDPQITKGEDARYYLVYSRWHKRGGDWLTNSEICMAVSDQPAGPYKHLTVLLKGRGPGHWDELMACNGKIKKFGAKYYLYYISSKSCPARWQIRNSQRSGVAVSSHLTGPYEALDAPIVEPAAPVNTLTVNPTVEAMPDGRYLMMVKGDRYPPQPSHSMGQRVQGLAIADKPTGPFAIRPELAIKDFDTEDAEMWWDSQRGKYFAVYHAHKYIGLIESADGFHWQAAKHPRVVEGNRLQQANGTVLTTEQGPLQRPGVYLENGEPRVLCLAVPMKDNWYVVTVPLARQASMPATRGH